MLMEVYDALCDERRLPSKEELVETFEPYKSAETGAQTESAKTGFHRVLGKLGLRGLPMNRPE